MKYKPHPISGYLVNIDGTEIYNPKTGYKLNPSVSPAGYLRIGQYICSGGSVHQLVIEAWKELVPKGMQVNHIDGNKLNNHIDNLEIVTPRENTIHAYKNGLATGKVGESNSMSKLTDEEIKEVFKMLECGYCNECIANKFNLHSRYVSLIRSGKRWSTYTNLKFGKSNKRGCICSSATTIESIGQ